jgi:hypothetical protein
MSNQNKRSWNILNWNVRLNSDDKRNAIRVKIEESSCAICCLQETKTQVFDHSAVKKMAPERFNKFAWVPSEGASGGIYLWDGIVQFSQGKWFSPQVLLSQSNSQQYTMQRNGSLPQSMGPVRDSKGKNLLIGSTACK